MAVLKTLFRFPEINQGFVASAWGGGEAGHLTPHALSPHGGEFDQKKKNVKCPGVSLGGAWAPLDLTRTLLCNWLHIIKGQYNLTWSLSFK